MNKYKGNFKFWTLVAILLEPEIKKIEMQQISPLLSKKDKKGVEMKKKENKKVNSTNEGQALNSND